MYKECGQNTNDIVNLLSLAERITAIVIVILIKASS
jgi:hypothetical protein